MSVINPDKINRILLVRTDRIGDVVVTTPVFRAIKSRFPDVHLAVMVDKQNADLILGHPDLNEVIMYDKRGAERSIRGTFQFARALKQRKFDIAVHFHPRTRAYWTTFLAGIPVRIGYKRKSHWLLTHSIKDDKGQGKKHEAAYNFDLLKLLSVAEPREMTTHIPLQEKTKESALQHVSGAGRYFAVHPSASSPSKIWPAQYYAETADHLAKKFQLTPVLIGGEADSKQGKAVLDAMKTKALNLCGQLTLGELAWILKGSEFVLSNDSGPAHMASAVKTPVISIFGRSLPGLGPRRWHPLGSKSWYLQKDVGCEVCLADLCQIEFKCLTELKPADVIQLIEKKQNEIFQHAKAG